MVKLPKVSVNTNTNEGLCFGCGCNNPLGLKLSFERVGSTVRAEFLPGKLYQSWPGIVHGGIITCALDEAMNQIAHFEGVSCLTAKMQVRFKKPASINEVLVVTSSIIKKARRLLETKASIFSRDGDLVAEATATQFVIEAERPVKGKGPVDRAGR